MKIEKNKNIDIIRAIAILLVLFYHIYAITGISFNNEITDTFLEYGGVIGVCLFFILSGFGIYNSLKNQEVSNKEFSFNDYIKKRFWRIAPQYYFSLIILLLFSSNAIYLSNDHLLTIISHIFFFHNFFYTIAGAISGVCWTLAVTFQFYLIAPFIYYIFKKYPKMVLISSYILSFLLKYFIFHFIIAASGDTNTFLYFNYGSQIFTALEFFVSGMFIAYLLNKYSNNTNHNYIYILLNIIFVVLLYFLIKMTYSTTIPYINNTGIYSDCTLAYIWHFLLSILLTIMVYYFSKIKIEHKTFFSKILFFVSKYEYGIYIWHLIIITTLSSSSPFFKNLISTNSIYIYVYYILISVFIGYIMTKFIDEYDYQKLDLLIIKKVIYIVASVFIIYCLKETFMIIKPTIGNINTYFNEEIIDVNESKRIADNIKSKVDINNNCKYIYLDTEETGYLYFFQLRYYLSPCESIHYNSYAYTSNYGSETEFYNFLKKQDVKYIIIRKNSLLSEKLNMKFDEEYGSIFIKNNKSNSIDNILIPIDNDRKKNN